MNQLSNNMQLHLTANTFFTGANSMAAAIAMTITACLLMGALLLGVLAEIIEQKK